MGLSRVIRTGRGGAIRRRVIYDDILAAQRRKRDRERQRRYARVFGLGVDRIFVRIEHSRAALLIARFAVSIERDRQQGAIATHGRETIRTGLRRQNAPATRGWHFRDKFAGLAIDYRNGSATERYSCLRQVILFIQ